MRKFWLAFAGAEVPTRRPPSPLPCPPPNPPGQVKKLSWKDFCKYFTYFLEDEYPDVLQTPEDMEMIWGVDMQLRLKRYFDPHNRDQVHFTVLEKRFPKGYLPGDQKSRVFV
jgi:hypothetical protein